MERRDRDRQRGGRNIEEELQEERNQILTAQPEDIQALGDLVEAVLKQRNICVVGSESALEKNREILKQIEPLVQ